ncbi:NlpC/P60 family protein [uncultured Tateyamaria sp.]|uniref:C40 family peptidase n=1 Tax=uncultured Tateyamaria sp. TaxID=455651 RepID=UPI00261A0E66|nr:NlpC/P60 family protein [uncultured Tateyamaria sp.]
MSDPRTTPNPDYLGLDRPGQILWPHVDLCRMPGGVRDRQLLCGAHVTVMGEDDTHAYIRAAHDGYIGFVPSRCIGTQLPPTHHITSPGAHAYRKASIKAPETAAFSFGAALTARTTSDDFVETHLGHVPKAQLTPLPSTNPTDTARLFLGTPYLWGGNTRAGIDCSGLVQIALTTANQPCPGDSDQQEAETGIPVPDQDYRQNDLLFWEGHVALITSPTTMIHANAYHMQVVEEDITTALDRIARTAGPVTSHKRITPFF